jgi:hypothetical protein
VNTAARLGAYGAALAVVSGGAFVAADAVVPQSTVDNWTMRAKGHDVSTINAPGSHGSHGGSASGSATVIPGVTSAQDGYLLNPVTAPADTKEEGTLSFAITGPDGQALTSFATSHEKELHLIVVRSDGTQFRHEHPTMDSAGTWSLPWKWAEVGTYRVYAEFVPDSENAPTYTLTRTVEVAGYYNPATSATLAASKSATVGPYTIELDGELTAGAASELTFTVSKDGQRVTNLEPYLGAFGHLVALRDGDLAYLHVHPEGGEPQAGDTSGPEVSFHAEAPTAGRYFLYLDFQVDGDVYSAPFVVHANTTASESDSHESSSHESDSDSTHSH